MPIRNNRLVHSEQQFLSIIALEVIDFTVVAFANFSNIHAISLLKMQAVKT